MTNIPGLPNLLPSAAALFSIPALLTADSLVGYGSVRPQWGVFQGGQEVIHFDTFLSIDFRRGWAIADYPVENGAFASYDKVALPYDVRVRFAAGGNESNRAALLNS